MKTKTLFSAALLGVLFSAYFGATVAQTPAAQDSLLQFGSVLYDTLQCAACHYGPPSGVNIPPSLEAAGSKYQLEWLAAYMLKPESRRWIEEKKRPLVRMPDFRLTERESQALALFLASQTDSLRFPEISVTADSAMLAEGKDIYDDYACYGCHTIDGDGGEVGPDLSDVGSRLKPGYLKVFLKDPLKAIPGTPMKNFDFWDEEIQPLVAWLMSLKKKEQ